MTWRFNRNYDDKEQVAEFLPRFLEVKAAIIEAGGYPYNDSFKGRIPGIEGPDEDSAIYLLQQSAHLQDLDSKVTAYLNAGFEKIETVDAITKFARVVHYGFYTGGTGWQEWQDARLVPQDRPQQAAVSGKIKAVLPKGRRTRGNLIWGKVLVKR